MMNRNLSMNLRNTFPSFIPAVPVPPPIRFDQTILRRLKLSEFHGHPLEWPELSRLLTAIIKIAPIDDNEKVSHLKTLVKGKTKAANAAMQIFAS